MKPKPITDEQRQAFERYRIYEGFVPKSDFHGTGGRFYLWLDGMIKAILKAWGRS